MKQQIQENQTIKQKMTFDVVLTDGVRKLGFITCDSAGNYSWKALTRSSLTRNALQTTATNNKYSDLIAPWISIAQDDWKGGRGQETLSDDTTRYFDNKRGQTGFEHVYNGPLDYYATGYKDSLTNYPGSVKWKKLILGKNNYIATKTIVQKPMSIGEAYFLIRRRGLPETAITISICTGSDSGPINTLISKSFSASDFTDTISEFKKITFTTQSLTSGQRLWIVINGQNTDENNYWEIGTKPNSNSNSKFGTSFNALTSACDYDVYYRLADIDNTYQQTKFFVYNHLLFMLRQEKNGIPKLYMNGEIGYVSSVSGTTITDTNKNWSSVSWENAQFLVFHGKGIEDSVSFRRKIISSSTNTFIIESAMNVTPDTTTNYIIYDTPYFTEIPSATHGLTGYVTDICVVNGIIYFAQGDYIPIRKLYWSKTGWVSSNETYTTTINAVSTSVNNCASFLQGVRDSDGLMIWRGQNYDDNGNRSVSMSSAIDVDYAEITLANEVTEIAIAKSGYTSASVDFLQGDKLAKTYKLTVGTITESTADKFDHKVTVTIQESRDNLIFKDVKKFDDIDKTGGIAFLTCRCVERYRRIKIEMSGYITSINNINVVTFNSLYFGEKINVNLEYGKINKMLEYGAGTTKALWVAQDSMISSINKDSSGTTYTLDRINLAELATTADEHNAETLITSDVNFMFAWQNGIQKLYDTEVDSDGPDINCGLPDDRKGRIVKMLGYPSCYFAAVDGENGFSSVLMNNGTGWNEIYRAPNSGERIWDIDFQPIYGTRPDRLWIGVGTDIVWLAMPSKTIKATNDNYAEYTHESCVTSSWITAGMTDVDKLWNSLKIISENLNENEITIEADYQLDEDTNWTPLNEIYTTSPSQKVLFTFPYSVHGKRMRYRLRMMTTNYLKTPIVKAVVVEAVGRVEVKYSYNFASRNVKYAPTLMGTYEEIEPKQIQDIYDEWVDKAQALYLTSPHRLFSDKRVYPDAISISNIGEKEEQYVLGMTLNEI